jgi:hypothetical protein
MGRHCGGVKKTLQKRPEQQLEKGGPIINVQSASKPLQLAACAGIGRDDAGDERRRAQPQPRPDLAAALGGAHVVGKRDSFGQRLRFRQLMQRQPDGAFVLAQRGGDLGDGCHARPSRQTRSSNSQHRGCGHRPAFRHRSRARSTARFSPSASGPSSWPIHPVVRRPPPRG